MSVTQSLPGPISAAVAKAVSSATAASAAASRVLASSNLGCPSPTSPPPLGYLSGTRVRATPPDESVKADIRGLARRLHG
jgi:hypothetical protein